MRKERLSRVDTRWRQPAALVMLASALLLAGPEPAQGQTQGTGIEGLGETAVGPWHAASSILGTGDGPSLVETARTELALGNPDRAIDLLTDSTGLALTTSVDLGLALAEAYYARGDFARASEHFAWTAALASDDARPALLARAGDAAEHAGLRSVAGDHYRRAAELPSPGAAWLRLRAARMTDDLDEVRRLLANPPAGGGKLAGRVEAEAAELAADTTNAIELYASLGLYADGARLSRTAGHLALARELLYAALDGGGADEAREAAGLALEQYPPTNAIEVEQLARALVRNGRARDAASLVDRWAVSDSSEAVLHLLGEMKEAAGDRWGALAAYGVAARGVSAAAGESEYRRIRLLVRMGRSSSAIAALKTFPLKFAEHRRTSWAAYLLGDLWWDSGLRAASDSVFERVVEAWPQSEYADRARYRLAARALLRGDTATAIDRFQRAADGGGDQARVARFQLAVLLQASGRRDQARDVFVQLAREDSIGYYGLIAREEAQLPLPYFPEPVRPAVSPHVQEILATLDFLDRIGFAEEAEALLDYAVGEAGLEPEEGLELAEGLVQRNRTVRAIRYGWRLSRHFSLNHPRLIRVIFPFPNRALVEAEAVKFNLDPFLVAGMIRQESAFDVEAVSRAGAQGLMQLMPATARGLAQQQGLNWTNTFLTVADANVHVGTAYLSALMRRYGDHVEQALAAYNAGGRPVRRWLRYPEAGDRYRWIERVPYVETRGYLKAVLRNRDLYRALYGEQLIP